MVLHLPGIALHPAGRPDARHDLVGKGAQIEEALLGIDKLGEARLAAGAVDMRHLDSASRHAFKGMQQDEAGAIGEEIRRRTGRAGEPQRAVRFADNLRRPWQFAIRCPAERIEGHPEAGPCLLHREIGQLRAGGIPVPVPHQIGDAAQRLSAVIADPAQRPALQRRRHRTGRELDALGNRLRRAEQCDCPIKHFRRACLMYRLSVQFRCIYRSSSRGVSIEACGSPPKSTMYLSRDNHARRRRYGVHRWESKLDGSRDAARW